MTAERGNNEAGAGLGHSAAYRVFHTPLLVGASHVSNFRFARYSGAIADFCAVRLDRLCDLWGIIAPMHFDDIVTNRQVDRLRIVDHSPSETLRAGVMPPRAPNRRENFSAAASMRRPSPAWPRLRTIGRSMRGHCPSKANSGLGSGLFGPASRDSLPAKAVPLRRISFPQRG